MAKIIAANSPAVVSAIKKGVINAQGLRSETAETYEKAMSIELMEKEDVLEGVMAFKEKRVPHFADLR